MFGSQGLKELQWIEDVVEKKEGCTGNCKTCQFWPNLVLPPVWEWDNLYGGLEQISKNLGEAFVDTSKE